MLMRIKVLFCVCLLPMFAWGQNRVPRAAWFVDGAKVQSENRSHTSLEAMEPGSSVIYATNGVKLILTQLRMNKTSGSIMDEDRRERGINSVLFADGASIITVENCSISSHTAMADGITSYGEGTLIKMIGGTVVTNWNASVGVNAQHKGEFDLNRIKIKCVDNHSFGIYASDSGLVNITGSEITNGGQAAPSFYASTGIIKGSLTKAYSAKWTVGNVDDGLLELTECELRSGGVSGFMVYGADGKERTQRSTGTLVLNKNDITVDEGPVIFVTNACADITLIDNKISYHGDEIISIKADEWGTKGINQGDATINVEKQTLKGDIYVDSISSLNLTLGKGAKLNGEITGNPVDTRSVKVMVNKGSTWTAKGDVYISSILFEQPLEKGLKQLKGKHVIYYDASNLINSYLEGKEYKTGGGWLRPMN